MKCLNCDKQLKIVDKREHFKSFGCNSCGKQFMIFGKEGSK